MGAWRMNGSGYIGDAGFGIASTGNSSTASLAGAATFTGVAEQNPFPDVLCSCFADVAGTLFLEYSDNGTDWRAFPESGYSIAAGAHEFHTGIKGPRQFRTRFVNGASAQTQFQLSAYYGTFSKHSLPLNQTAYNDSDAFLVRPSVPWLDIARGLVDGVTTVRRIGQNIAVGTSFVPVSIGGVYEMPQSGSATALRVQAGGNANDTAAGTGARSITMEGLDSNFNAVSEAVATAGISASSATTATFTRLFRAYVTPLTGSGTYATSTTGSHSADIVIENGAGGTDWATINATDYAKGQSAIGAYTIPAGKTGYVRLLNISADAASTFDILFFSRSGSDETVAPYSGVLVQPVIEGLSGGAINNTNNNIASLGAHTGPADVGFMAKVDAGTGSISVEFEIVLVDN